MKILQVTLVGTLGVVFLDRRRSSKGEDMLSVSLMAVGYETINQRLEFSLVDLRRVGPEYMVGVLWVMLEGSLEERSKEGWEAPDEFRWAVNKLMQLVSE